MTHELDPDKAYLYLVDGEILAKVPYGYNYQLRNQVGAQWWPDKKVWRIGLTMSNCQALRRLFGENLVVGPQLFKWARKQIELDAEVTALTSMNSFNLTKVPLNHQVLDQAMSNRTYQQVAAAFIAKQRRALIAHEPGLGKTLEAIAGLIEADCWHGMILVTAPLTSLRPVWEKELKTWAPDAYVTIGVPKRGGNALTRIAIQEEFLDHYAANPLQPHILVVNPEMLRERKEKGTNNTFPVFPLLQAVEWQGIVCDESHRYLSGIKSRRQMTQTGRGLMGLKLADSGVKIAMSGTPMRGRASNLWGTLHWLFPKVYTSFWAWAEQYFWVSRGGYGNTIGELKAHKRDDFYKSLDGIVLRKTKAEVAKDLPPKMRLDVYCDMTELQETMYRQMEALAIAEIEGLDIDDENNKLSAIGVLAIMTRLKQFADCTMRNVGVDGISPKAQFDPMHSGKAALIEEMLIERGIAGDVEEREGTGKIVIASQFTQVIDSLESYLASIDVPTMKITGAVREQKRVEITETFQGEGGPRVLLMNTTAGGVAITLDAYCDELIIVDETWTPDDQEQLEDRIHRVSRIHQVTIYRLYTSGTIDEYIKNRTLEKDTIQKEILDGRRGVQNLIAGITSCIE
jgi:SNF2 family DNA or RNA helicase